MSWEFHIQIKQKESRAEETSGPIPASHYKAAKTLISLLMI